MVNWLKTILDPSSTTASVFAGDVMNWVVQYHSDVDLAAGDPLGIVKVATETIFASGKLKLYDSNKSHSIAVATPDFVENKTLNIPSTLPTTDDMVTRTAVQTVTNKQFDFTLNTFLNFPGFAAGGSRQFNGTGSQTVFNIPHTLTGGIPSIFFALPKTNDTIGRYTVTADATNVIITYNTAPPSGTNNVDFVWGAGGATGESVGFSASSVSTLTNKKIGDFLGFIKQGSTPSNPSLEESIIYEKAVDASNNGIFVKIKRAGAIVEIQIA
jgi:hypothetical protein